MTPLTCIVLIIMMKILTAKSFFSVHMWFRSKCLGKYMTSDLTMSSLLM